MSIQVLISTMNIDKHEELISKLKVSNSVTINQTNQDSLSSSKNIGKHLLYSFNEKGLSRSRNRAIENATSDICVLADDDLEYELDYEKIVDEGYKKYPKADIIAFYVDNIDKKLQRPKRKEGKIGFIKSMRIQSVQITFKRDSIINNNIKFKENFGTGTELYMGEENIFLTECLRKGLKIYYIPNKIATIQDNESTWFKGYNKKYFQVKGCAFYEMSKIIYPLLIIQFAVRKRNLYSREVKMLKSIKYMFQGVKKYKEGKV